MTDNTDDHIDYRSIDVPDDKPPEEYSYAERRAEILRRIEDAGHPGLVNGAELGRRYDVARQSIYNDFDVLGEYVADTVGERVDLKINAVFNKAIRGLLQQKEYRKAAKTAAEFGEWVEARHEIEDLWDELEEIQDTVNDDQL
jgi:hypothetical protein